MSIKQDLEYIECLNYCLCENIDHEADAYRLSKAKQILEEKMKDASKEGKEYLQRQYDIVSKKHEDAINKYYELKTMHNKIAAKLAPEIRKSVEAEMNQNAQQALYQMQQQELDNQQMQQPQYIEQPQAYEQQPDQTQNYEQLQNQQLEYDENNPDHKKLISSFHKSNMEKVRAAKNLKEDSQLAIEKAKIIQELVKQKTANSNTIIKNSQTNLRHSKQKMINNANNS